MDSRRTSRGEVLGAPAPGFAGVGFLRARKITEIAKKRMMTTTRINSELGALNGMAAPLARSVRGIGVSIQCAGVGAGFFLSADWLQLAVLEEA